MHGFEIKYLLRVVPRSIDLQGCLTQSRLVQGGYQFDTADRNILDVRASLALFGADDDESPVAVRRHDTSGTTLRIEAIRSSLDGISGVGIECSGEGSALR